MPNDIVQLRLRCCRAMADDVRTVQSTVVQYSFGTACILFNLKLFFLVSCGQLDGRLSSCAPEHLSPRRRFVHLMVNQTRSRANVAGTISEFDSFAIQSPKSLVREASMSNPAIVHVPFGPSDAFRVALQIPIALTLSDFASLAVHGASVP